MNGWTYTMEYFFVLKEVVTFYTMSEFWKHAKWNKPVTKGHILYDSIHMKVQSREIYRDKID